MYHLRGMTKNEMLPARGGQDGVASIDWIERAAVGASFACLIHCLALPLLLAAMPVLSSVLAIPEEFHLWVLAFAVPASGAALVSGRLRHHAIVPMLLGVFGLTLLALGAIVVGGERWETPVTVIGSLTLASAHLLNWRMRHGAGYRADQRHEDAIRQAEHTGSVENAEPVIDREPAVGVIAADVAACADDIGVIGVLADDMQRARHEALAFRFPT